MKHIFNHCSVVPESLLSELEDFVAKNGLAEQVSYGPGENTQCAKLILDPPEPCTDELYLRISLAALRFLSNFARQYVIPKHYPLRHPAFEPIELRRMLGPTREHSDGISPQVNANGISYRVASLILTVSDSADEIIFPSQGVRIPLRRGDVVVFPPYWTHRHFTISKTPGRVSIVTHLRETAPHADRKETLFLPLEFPRSLLRP